MGNYPTLFEDSDLSGVRTVDLADGKVTFDANSKALLVGANTLDDRYYTEAEVDALVDVIDAVLSTKADSTEVTLALEGKANVATTLADYGITDGQPLDADLTAIAALATTAHGRGLLTGVDAAATRTSLGLGTMATQAASSYLALSGGTLTGALTGTNITVSGLTLSHPSSHMLAIINAPATNEAGFKFQRAGVDKWELFSNNADSSFRLYNYGIGSYAITVNGSTNNVTLGGSLTVTGGLTLGTSSNLSVGNITSTVLAANNNMVIDAGASNECGILFKHVGVIKWQLYSNTGSEFHLYNATTASRTLVVSAASNSVTLTNLLFFGAYTFATLPSASANAGACLRITDRGQKLAYSNGTNWLFVHDNSVVV